MAWIKARLAERNTWVSLVTAVAGIFGVTLAPDLALLISGAVAAVLTVYGVAAPEHRPPG